MIYQRQGIEALLPDVVFFSSGQWSYVFMLCQMKSKWRCCGALPRHEFNKSLIEEPA